MLYIVVFIEMCLFKVEETNRLSFLQEIVQFIKKTITWFDLKVLQRRPIWNGGLPYKQT